jgi:hypothetical protein
MNNIEKGFDWVVARIKEPSTWAGAGIVATVVHLTFPGPLGDNIIAMGAAFGGILAVILPEKSTPAQ